MPPRLHFLVSVVIVLTQVARPDDVGEGELAVVLVIEAGVE